MDLGHCASIAMSWHLTAQLIQLKALYQPRSMRYMGFQCSFLFVKEVHISSQMYIFVAAYHSELVNRLI